MDKFKDIMSAITFAEAGEQEKAREFLKGRKKILLAISDLMFDQNVLKYAKSISRRIEADIHILYLTRTGARETDLKEFMVDISKSDGMKCSIVKRDGCMKKAILDYTEKIKEVMFVIVGSTPELEIECKAGERTLSDEWKRMRCPLVVVSKSEVPSPA